MESTPERNEREAPRQIAAAAPAPGVVLDTLDRSRLPRATGFLAHDAAREGTYHCPYCEHQHVATMRRGRLNYARTTCRRLPPGVVLYVLVRAQ